MAAIPYHEDVLSLQWAGPFPSHHKRHAVNRGLQGVTTALLQSFGNTPPVARASAAASAETHPADQLKLTIHRKLLSTIDFKKLDTEVENDPVKKEELEREVRRVAVALIDELAPHLVREERNTLLRQVIQETLGLGPLEDLLADTDITEIMVNRWDQIYIERSGRLIETGLQFFSDAHLVNIIGRIVGPLGRKIDISTPMVDARLPDGSRVNAVIPPLAINGASLTIRKFAQERLNMEALEAFGSLNRQVAEFLMAAVCARLNIVVSGGTGSGKTTLLNILSGYIPEGERIITIEDSAELKLHQPHVVPLECRPPNIEGKGEITIRDLLRNALRMRPDRIVVGECRGGEALDMLQAMNTGHDGSMTTIHANTTQEALARIETLVMYTGFELPSRGIKEQIAGAVDLIIQVKRFKDGSRKLIQVSELRGISEDRIRIDDVFLFNQIDEVDGTPRGMHVATGFVPESVQRFQEKGIHLPRELFWAN
ncbi:MAG: hypothetical protein CSA22_02535 [Deltaproteobacteria bacterium]|nr:MAG: hypothetical protein CSA22_02535 [Deltaproteobacteria bacterium]